MSAVCGPVQSCGVFVDTYTASEFTLPTETVQLTSSLSNVDSSSVDKLQSLLFRPVTPGDKYSVTVRTCHVGGAASVRVVEGACAVNGVKCDSVEASQLLSNGSFLELGSSYRLQYKATPTNKKPHPLRILPSTPDGGQSPAPPISPDYTAHFDNEVIYLPSCGEVQTVGLTSGSFSGSVDCGAVMEDGLRVRLKRIAKEVTVREGQQIDTHKRPPPPYEQVANSINYQLLHHSHPRVTCKLIDSLYHALKEMQLKDSQLFNVYSSFLSSYLRGRGESATPNCMMPADLPVVRFILDMIMHICCMPDMTPLVERICPLWMDILSIFTTSRPNREEVVRVGGASRLLSCMNLSVMSDSVLLQERGWAILGSIVDCPTPPGSKAVIIDASLSLVVSLVTKQPSTHHAHLPLMIAFVHTLARLATVAKEAIGYEIGSQGDIYPTYTPLQGEQVLRALKDCDVIGRMMCVPPGLRTHPLFQDNYCALVKALHPIRLRKTVPRELTPPLTTPHLATPTKPPPKPARAHKMRRFTVATDQLPPEMMTTNHDGYVTTGYTPSRQRVSKLKHGQRPHSYSSITTVIDDGVHPLLASHEHHLTTKYATMETRNIVIETVASDGKLQNTSDNYCISDAPPLSPSNTVDQSHLPSNTIYQSDSPSNTVDQSDLPSNTVNQSDLPSNTVDQSDLPSNTVDQSDLPSNTVDKSDLPSSTVNQSDSLKSDTLSRDVQSLLDSLRAPIPLPVTEGRSQPRRDSVYFKASFKRRSRKSTYTVRGRPVLEGGRGRPLLEVGRGRPLFEGEEKSDVPGSSGRMKWSEATPIVPLLLSAADNVSLFEVSGEGVLSPNHTLLEEVISGHTDVTTTLRDRVELLEGVLFLWREDKGLQAVTNTIQGCFNEEGSDLPLFMDALNCFIFYKNPWTLAVCCVLLPPLKELVATQRDSSCVLTAVGVVTSIVDRFSELILACKARSGRVKRLSVATDRQQQLLCYQQLHAIHVAIGNRLEGNSDPTEVKNALGKLHSELKPFMSELNDC